MVRHGVHGPKPQPFTPRWVRFGSVTLLAVLATSACTHAKTSSAPTLSIQMSQGSATITGGGKTEKVTDRAGVGVGYHVTVAPDSLAMLHLGNGRSFELTEGEAFITGASQIVMPVVRIDGRLIGGGRPGPLATALRREFHKYSEWE